MIHIYHIKYIKTQLFILAKHQLDSCRWEMICKQHCNISVDFLCSFIKQLISVVHCLSKRCYSNWQYQEAHDYRYDMIFFKISFTQTNSGHKNAWSPLNINTELRKGIFFLWQTCKKKKKLIFAISFNKILTVYMNFCNLWISKINKRLQRYINCYF